MDRISSDSSILMTVPRTWRVYLLIAVWVMPKMLATSFCFMWYDLVSSIAMEARIDGTTDLTAISQGISMGFTESIVLCRNLYKHDVCHFIYDVCHWRGDK
jgi:hypothetical protein